MEKKKRTIEFTMLFIFYIFLSGNINAQEPLDSLDTHLKPHVLEAIQSEKLEYKPKGKTNFEHWMYTQKKHAFMGYLGSIAQGGYSGNMSANTWHYDLGALYQGKLVETKNYKMKGHAWVEHTNLVAGSDPKTFAKQLDMFTVPNANDETSSGLSLEYLHIENFFFDGLLDITVGKLEPTFYMSFTKYSAWDKLTLFSKTASSDPVPDMDAAFGVYAEVNFSEYFSVGGQVLDDNPRNDILDVGNFFGKTTYNWQGFLRWAIPSKNNYYSYHLFNVYTNPQSADKASGSGWMYVGNQGVSDNLILTLKLSNGHGRILKYNGAYTAGFILNNPFSRIGDQTGAAFVVNELGGKYEYGIDTFYEVFLQDWITFAGSLQGYYTMSENIAVIPGLRLWITY
ncbi:carbohydrate porin [Cognatitamlana onchidii]|uniref:carbohydrate porin n=1 Tax=Cognatitamlana onchidii TaxID=2562860 RepID=UPI0010A5D50D|nr:carbohydrate porin [Algibacter onchidii]